MEISQILQEIEQKLIEASKKRFTGEIRLTFNMSQGGFSQSYIEQEKKNLIQNQNRKQ